MPVARPILFSAPMIRALLDGRKTQTRRIVKQRTNPHDFLGGLGDDKNAPHNWGFENPDLPGHFITLPEQRYPYGRPGDLLWVRENFTTLTVPAAGFPDHEEVWYKAFTDEIRPVGNYEQAVKELKWKPSIHMPRAFSRLTLEITDIRVHRLQEISDEDAKAEEIENLGLGRMGQPLWRTYGAPQNPESVCALLVTDTLAIHQRAGILGC